MIFGRILFFFALLVFLFVFSWLGVLLLVILTGVWGGGWIEGLRGEGVGECLLQQVWYYFYVRMWGVRLCKLVG